MNGAPYDAVIVGAGIVGAACADEFARRGLGSVAGRSGPRFPSGSGATAAGMGHDRGDGRFREAQFALTRYSQRLWQELRRELPDDVEYEQCGTIWVAADEEELIEVRRKHDYYGSLGVPTEVLDSRQLKLLEPEPTRGDGWRPCWFPRMESCIHRVRLGFL